MKLIIIFVSIFFGLAHILIAKTFGADSIITFESPRALIPDDPSHSGNTSAVGIVFDFSYFGFGTGIFWQKNIAKDWEFISDFTFSNVKNSDEFEPYDRAFNEYYTRGKVSRIYMFPITAGVKRFVFTDELSQSFRPYLTFGGGPSFVLSMPYSEGRVENAPKISFFDSFSDMRWSTRFGFYIGVGSEFQTTTKIYSAINVSYYYYYYGGGGIASMANDPMKSFQSICLNLSIGKRY